MWSVSILVITDITGDKYKNEASLSSASATKYCPLPNLALVPAAVSLPPITKVGSKPAAPRIDAVKLVVVVLPCVPAMAIPSRKRISSANIMARGITGICCANAASTSGLSGLTAVEVTTTSAPLTCSAVCPGKTRTPKPSKWRVTALWAWSEPET